MKQALASVAVITLIAIPFSVQAQVARVEDTVEYHQSSTSSMRTHLRRIEAAVMAAESYDKAALETDVTYLEMVLQRDVFTAGSYIANSKGPPETWKEPDKFKAASEKMQTEAEKLSVTAKSGDLNTIKVAVGAVAQSCRACHVNFRNR